MKFNGEVWKRIPVTQKGKVEPDEYVIVKNEKNSGGLIPYARYGDNWTTTVPIRSLIRELMLLLDTPKSTSCDHCKIEIPIETLACCRECGRVYEMK